MGLIVEGTPMTWKDIVPISGHIRYRAALQFLKSYQSHKHRTGDPFLWGDEIEYMLIKLDHTNSRAVLSLNSSDVLKKLRQNNDANYFEETEWHPEMTKYIIEGIPKRPYGMRGIIDLVSMETNMRLRRKQVADLLGENEKVLTISSFPRLGCDGCTDRISNPTINMQLTSCVMDDLISEDNFKFRGLIQGVEDRRGNKVTISIPVYKDKNTNYLSQDEITHEISEKQETDQQPNDIAIDHALYGPACCCIQVTIQAKNLEEAKYLYDQLIPLCPIMAIISVFKQLALSVVSPLYKGFMTDIDTRWPVYVQTSDDRTLEERKYKYGEVGHKGSRTGCVDCYLTSDIYNDREVTYDEHIYNKLTSEGVDDLMSKHIAYQLIHDPLTLHEECLNENNNDDTEIYDTMNSSNWRILRLKLPIPEQNMGWRIEFRPMDVQLTDFENAAYTVFVTLLARVILEFGLDFTIPLSKVDDNLNRASRRNAVLEDVFYFKTNNETNDTMNGMKNDFIPESCDKDYVQMTIDEIMHGKDEYKGVIYFMNKYIDRSEEFDTKTKSTLNKYIKLISDRASGKEKTRARWVRDIVENHPSYKHDSVISDDINYDLMVKCVNISDIQ
ncbi:hypothetical protein ACF0H5_019754 [Mactra antiquata]